MRPFGFKKKKEVTYQVDRLVVLCLEYRELGLGSKENLQRME